MKILMLCGYFAKANEAEVIRHARSAVQFSANQFQRRLIGGFHALGQELHVISAPFIGSFPNESDIDIFHGFDLPQDECRYVDFRNLWGLRNFSRAKALKKAIHFFIDDPCDDKLILVYCPHTPFLEAAHYAKKMDPRIKISFYVPDLPKYMNLNSTKSKFYDFAKSVDIARMTRYMQSVDAYILLTEPMKQALPVGEKPCMVVEGIMAAISVPEPAQQPDDGLHYVVYTGKLNGKFGIRELVDGFSMISQPDYRLVLCGSGDCMKYARTAAAKDKRIILTGQITPEEAAMWQRKAAVLINPRSNNEPYTKYSFPSKLIEYLQTGKPVAAYMLDGMPERYRAFLFEIDPSRPGREAIRDAIVASTAAEIQEQTEKYTRFLRYAAEHLLAEQIARKITEMTGMWRDEPC